VVWSVIIHSSLKWHWYFAKTLTALAHPFQTRSCRRFESSWYLCTFTYVFLVHIACMLMLHIAWSVCLSVCRARGWAVHKRLNQSRCHLGADSCGSKEPCIRWGSFVRSFVCSFVLCVQWSSLLWNPVLRSYSGPVCLPRERKGIGRCVRCVLATYRVKEGLSRSITSTSSQPSLSAST